MVLAVAVILVVGLARLLGGQTDAEDAGDQQATTVGTTTTPPAPIATETPRRKRKKAPATPTEPPLAEPTGACETADVVVTPVVPEAQGGTDVAITLNLRTRETAACTWTVSPETLTVSIRSGSDAIWSTRQCPTAIPTQDVVVRQAVDAPIGLTWNAKRSDEECSDLTEWARLGFYHVEAAALGGEPTDVQFELVRPASAVITKTVTPKPTPKRKSGKGKSRQSDTAHVPGEQGEGNSEG